MYIGHSASLSGYLSACGSTVWHLHSLALLLTRRCGSGVERMLGLWAEPRSTPESHESGRGDKDVCVFGLNRCHAAFFDWNKFRAIRAIDISSVWMSGGKLNSLSINATHAAKADFESFFCDPLKPFFVIPHLFKQFFKDFFRDPICFPRDPMAVWNGVPDGRTTDF